MEISRDNDLKRGVWKQQFFFLNQSLSSIVKIHSLMSTTSVLPLSPMAYNTIVSLDKLTCHEYGDFRKCQDRFG